MSEIIDSLPLDRRQRYVLFQIVEAALDGIFLPPPVDGYPENILRWAMMQSAMQLARAWKLVELHPDCVPAPTDRDYQRLRIALSVYVDDDATPEQLHEAWAAVQSTDDMGSPKQNLRVAELHDRLMARANGAR